MSSRQLKDIAKKRLLFRLGPIAGATATYAAIYVAVLMAVIMAYSMNLLTKGVFNSVEAMTEYIEGSTNTFGFFIGFEIVIILVSALMSTVSVAIQAMSLNAARGKKIKFSEILFVVKNNPDKVIIITIIQQLLALLFAIPQNVVSLMVMDSISAQIISFALMLFGYIADIIIVTLFSQSMFLYIDNVEESPLECISMSLRAMRKPKNFFRYLWLVISFIPLHIVGMISFGLFYLWLIPYQNTTMALFYLQLKGEIGSIIEVSLDEDLSILS